MKGYSRLFPGFVAIGDASYVRIQKPSDGNESYYYNPHRKTHCLNFAMFADKDGRCRHMVVRGGSRNERDVFTASALYRNEGRYFLPGQYVLYDAGGVGDGPIVCPFQPAQINRMSPEAKRVAREFNSDLARLRIRIEWVFGRMKSLFPVFGDRWEMDLHRLPPTWKACVLLLNYLYRKAGGITRDSIFIRETLNLMGLMDEDKEMKLDYIRAKIKEHYA